MVSSFIKQIYIISLAHIYYVFNPSFQIAREHGIPFLETSAKANINVEKAFMDLAQAILNKVKFYIYVTWNMRS